AGDFFQYPLLRRRRVKRQYLLNRLANPVVQRKRDSGLRFLLAALELQPQLDEKQFIENQPDVRRRARRLQIGKTLARIRPVHLPQRFSRRHQAKMRAYRRRNGIAQIGVQILQRPADNAPEPPRRKLPLPGRFVDRNNPPNLKRGRRFFLGLIRSALFVNVAKNLELRLHDLQSTVAVLFDLAIKRHHLSGLKAVLKIGGIEPDTLQPRAPLSDRELEDRHAPSPK